MSLIKFVEMERRSPILGQDLGWNESLDVDFFIARLKRCNLYFETLDSLI